MDTGCKRSPRPGATVLSRCECSASRCRRSTPRSARSAGASHLCGTNDQAGNDAAQRSGPAAGRVIAGDDRLLGFDQVDVYSIRLRKGQLLISIAHGSAAHEGPNTNLCCSEAAGHEATRRGEPSIAASWPPARSHREKPDLRNPHLIAPRVGGWYLEVRASTGCLSVRYTLRRAAAPEAAPELQQFPVGTSQICRAGFPTTTARAAPFLG